MSGTIPEELGTITVCAGPPLCPLEGDDVIAWQQAGCPRCRRIIVHADGTETEYQAKEVAKLVAEISEMAESIGCKFVPDPQKIEAFIKAQSTRALSEGEQG